VGPSQAAPPFHMPLMTVHIAPTMMLLELAAAAVQIQEQAPCILEGKFVLNAQKKTSLTRHSLKWAKIGIAWKPRPL